jgi:hypothetical protein
VDGRHRNDDERHDRCADQTDFNHGIAVALLRGLALRFIVVRLELQRGIGEDTANEDEDDRADPQRHIKEIKL